MLPRVLLSFSPAACRRLPQPLKSLYLQGFPAMIEASWVGALMENSLYLMRRRRQGRPLCGASRHVFEAAKVGNKLLIFRVTVTLADMEATGAGVNAPAFFCFMGAASGTPIMAAEEKAIFCMFVPIHGYTISRLSDLHPSQRSVALCQEVSEKS